jgi:hypothetical protein
MRRPAGDALGGWGAGGWDERGDVHRGVELAEKPVGTIVSRRRRRRPPLACGVRGVGQNGPFLHVRV